MEESLKTSEHIFVLVRVRHASLNRKHTSPVLLHLRTLIVPGSAISPPSTLPSARHSMHILCVQPSIELTPELLPLFIKNTIHFLNRNDVKPKLQSEVIVLL